MRMDKTVDRYYQLKQTVQALERQLAALRQEILGYCAERGLSEADFGDYRVKVVVQDRRVYDDRKLYEALPDPEVWRLISRADGSKIASLVKWHVIAEDSLRGTYTLNRVASLHVERR